MPASTYHYNKAKGPKAPTRPELWEDVAEIFSRTANGCGRRQIAMCLRAEKGVCIADKTALKIMREMGISCGISADRLPKYTSYKGRRRRDVREPARRRLLRRRAVAEAGGPTSPSSSRAGGKSHLAPVYDFGSKEIVAWSISEHPDMMQQKEMLAMLLPKVPAGSSPVMQSDMGRQHQHEFYCNALREAG